MASFVLLHSFAFASDLFYTAARFSLCLHYKITLVQIQLLQRVSKSNPFFGILGWVWIEEKIMDLSYFRNTK